MPGLEGAAGPAGRDLALLSPQLHTGQLCLRTRLSGEAEGPLSCFQGLAPSEGTPGNWGAPLLILSSCFRLALMETILLWMSQGSGPEPKPPERGSEGVSPPVLPLSGNGMPNSILPLPACAGSLLREVGVEVGASSRAQMESP